MKRALVEIAEAVAESTWRDWLANAAQLVGVAAIALAIMVIAIGFAPYTPGQ